MSEMSPVSDMGVVSSKSDALFDGGKPCRTAVATMNSVHQKQVSTKVASAHSATRHKQNRNEAKCKTKLFKA